MTRYRDSDVYTELEKRVIDLAVAMSRTPVEVPEGLRATLLEHFTKGELTELASAIAWENHRGRLNRALGVRPMGFSDGEVCVLPESVERGCP